MKCNTCQNERYCYDGNHQLTRDGCADNGFAAYVSKTNADRVRAMSDEELAVICEDGCPPSALSICNSVETIEGETMKEHCQRCWLSWLKAPVDKEEQT